MASSGSSLITVLPAESSSLSTRGGASAVGVTVLARDHGVHPRAWGTQAGARPASAEWAKGLCASTQQPARGVDEMRRPAPVAFGPWVETVLGIQPARVDGRGTHIRRRWCVGGNADQAAVEGACV